MLPALRAAVAFADPTFPAFGASTMERAASNALNTAETAATFAGSFGLLALVIASVGLDALVASGVAARTREIGVRMALGASPSRVFALVLGRTVRLSAIGISIGLAGAAAVGKMLGGLLVGLSPHDTATFVGVPLVLASVVVAASYLPARRATRLGLAAVLRG